jgi:transposase
MARPYSSDLRERVVEAVNEGATRCEAAEHFGVGVSSTVRWHQAWRETGTFEAKRCGGSRSPLEDYAEEIIALVEERRDRTLDEIVAAMHERRIPGSRTALRVTISRNGRGNRASRRAATGPPKIENKWQMTWAVSLVAWFFGQRGIGLRYEVVIACYPTHDLPREVT